MVYRSSTIRLRLPGAKRIDSVCAAASVFLEAQFDVGAVTLLAYPFLVSLIRLARTDRLSCEHPLAFFRHVFAAPFDNLNQVPAEGRLHGLADLSGFEPIHRTLEFRHRVSRRQRSEERRVGKECR